jgi:methyl-accepting chemotaxis protein
MSKSYRVVGSMSGRLDINGQKVLDIARNSLSAETVNAKFIIAMVQRNFEQLGNVMNTLQESLGKLNERIDQLETKVDELKDKVESTTTTVQETSDDTNFVLPELQKMGY